MFIWYNGRKMKQKQRQVIFFFWRTVCAILSFYYGVICGAISMFALKVFSAKSVCGVL